MFNQLKWNTKLAPTPLNRSFVLDKADKDCFGFITFDTQRELGSKLYRNANLLQEKQSYSLDLNSETEIELEVVSQRNYLVRTQTSDWITESQTVVIPKMSAIGIKPQGKVRLIFSDYQGFIIHDNENNGIFGEQLPIAFECETQDWISVENIDSKDLTVEIVL